MKKEKSELLIEMGQRIHIIRKEINLTQIELASAAEISLTALSETESGRIEPPFDLILFLADNYNVSLNYLIVGESPMFKEREKKILY